MTEIQLKYIKRQLEIIQGKANEDELNRYTVLLSGAKELDAFTSDTLHRAVEARRSELTYSHPFVEGGDISDIASNGGLT